MEDAISRREILSAGIAAVALAGLGAGSGTSEAAGDVNEMTAAEKANVKVVNRYGASPFSLACLKGNAVAIERLLRAGETANAIPMAVALQPPRQRKFLPNPVVA